MIGMELSADSLAVGDLFMADVKGMVWGVGSNRFTAGVCNQAYGNICLAVHCLNAISRACQWWHGAVGNKGFSLVNKTSPWTH
jgi:hypothetical protein